MRNFSFRSLCFSVLDHVNEKQDSFVIYFQANKGGDLGAYSNIYMYCRMQANGPFQLRY